jgi:hypothetical protein
VPVGYKEPEPIQKPVEDDEPMAVDVSEYSASSTFHAFSGQGNRLDGKNKPTTSAPNVIRPQDIKRGIPNYGYQKGKITFIRATRQLATDTEKENNKDLSQFTAFGGEGHSLRKKPQPPLAKPK